MVTKRSVEGTAIARRIATAHGGHLFVGARPSFFRCAESDRHRGEDPPRFWLVRRTQRFQSGDSTRAIPSEMYSVQAARGHEWPMRSLLIPQQVRRTHA